ncbi:uncharacterized protein LOC110699757 [Chenopodium quinoa]|uniref:uncharacterized protein LOC110699757 n=1 Tax=Chenopodium quinoa TaxID=63459 RepID=UPI000B77EBE6|nr:uncharacterized protein LOC110699757 [Chenopodium quinoa]
MASHESVPPPNEKRPSAEVQVYSDQDSGDDFDVDTYVAADGSLRTRHTRPLEIKEGAMIKLVQVEEEYVFSSYIFECCICYKYSKAGEHENETLENARERSKWDNDDFICRGHILNGMEDDLFDVYQNVESAKELWESLESKYMAEDASSKKFLVSNFNNFKFVDGRSIMDQFHELRRIYGSLEQHGIAMNDLFVVSSIIDKLLPSWKNVKHDLKHKKEDMTLSSLATHLQIEEGICAMEGAKDGNPSTSTVNMVDEGKASASTSGKRKNDNSFKNKSKKKMTGKKFTC